MPELPEVETIRRELAPQVVGRRVEAVDLMWPPVVARPDPDLFRRILVGRQVQALRRRGKYLIWDLDAGWHLILHLRMTGQVYVHPASVPPDRHTRAVVRLDDGKAVHYRDVRKFGRFYLVQDEALVVGGLGPEPLDPAWTPEVLFQALQGRRAPIKAVLLDQRVVAGLGNIYADEALFLARLSPWRPAGSLTWAEVQRLHGAIRQVLAEALDARGTSMRSYVPPSGRRGTYQQRRRVYRRTGEPCPCCGTPIVRERLSGRSTHYCPACQPLPG